MQLQLQKCTKLKYSAMKPKAYNAPGRKKPFGVKWLDENNKRKFKFFTTERERDDYLNDFGKQVQREGTSILKINAAEASIMAEAIEITGSATNVLLAAREWRERRTVKEIDVKDAITEYQRVKEMLGRDENYQRAKRKHFERIAAFMPDSFVDWDDDLAQQFAAKISMEFSPVTVKNHMSTAIGFCRWCVKRGYLLEVPFKNVELPHVIREEVEFLTVPDMQLFIDTALEHYPEAVPYTALNAFGGIRSSMCARLELVNIHFKQRGILIPAAQAKNKQRAYIDGFPDNLWAWLEWAVNHEQAREGFALSKRMWDKRREQIQEKAGIKLPHNAFRHSFASYHVAMNGDAGKTATLLSHRGNVSILYDHYKGAATKADGEAYFRINPR